MAESLFNLFFGKVDIPMINKEMSADLEETFSIQELKNTVNSMKNGKSLGPDGLPSEFYKKFTIQLALIFLSYMRNHSTAPSPQPCDSRLYHFSPKRKTTSWNAVPISPYLTFKRG